MDGGMYMKKILIIILCLTFFKLMDFNLQSLINPSKNESINMSETVTHLYNKMVFLETSYNNKLLKQYDINPDELNTKLEKIEDRVERENFKKQFVMEHTNLTEDEYQDIFVHPLTQIKNSSIDTISDLDELYTNLKTNVDYLESIIDSITN